MRISGWSSDVCSADLVARHSAVGMNYAPDPCQPAPWPTQLLWFEVFDKVCKNQAATGLMEKLHFGHEVAGYWQRCDFIIPGVAACFCELGRVKIDQVTHLLIDPWRQPDFRLGKRMVPFRYPPVVNPVRPDDVA